MSHDSRKRAFEAVRQGTATEQQLAIVENHRKRTRDYHKQKANDLKGIMNIIPPIREILGLDPRTDIWN
jgi:hypothetical protein